MAEARAQLGIARATKFPQLDGQASYTNQRFSEKSFPLNALGTGSAQQDFYRTGLDLTFELDLWGRLRRATEAGGRSCTSTGGSSFAASTSRAAGPCSAASTPS